MSNLFDRVLRHLPYIGFVFGVSVLLLVVLAFFDIGDAGPLDTVFLAVGGGIYVLLVLWTALTIGGVLYFRVFTKELGYEPFMDFKLMLFLVAVVQSLFWFVYWAFAAVRLGRKELTIAVLLHQLSIKFYQWANNPDDDSVIEVDGEPDNDRTLN